MHFIHYIQLYVTKCLDFVLCNVIMHIRKSAWCFLCNWKGVVCIQLTGNIHSPPNSGKM